MSILDKLSTALGRRDEVPNQEAAGEIVRMNDHAAVRELVTNLSHKDRNIQADCIKTLYEIGAAAPGMIRAYIPRFTELLHSKNNRMVWGAMSALDSIADEAPAALYKLLPVLMETAEKGSVITRDRFVNILVKLAAHKKYQDNVFSLLMEQIAASPTNQLPTYAEKAVPVLPFDQKESFLKLIRKRLPEIEGEAKKNRMRRILEKVGT